MNTRFIFAIVTIAAFGASPRMAMAQGDGARIYWKSLSDANAITFSPRTISGNSNPLDPAHVQTPDANFEANIAIVGYSKTLDLFGRSAIGSLLLPVGNVSGEVSGVPLDQQQSASGYGDPMMQMVVNLYGAPAMNDLPSVQRYEPKFTLDLLTSLAIPVGEYDGSQLLNIGQNRWYGRIGAPMMLTFGPWIPGERTTLEVLPAAWLFADNHDYLGQTLSTAPYYQVEGHLTRDFTSSAWGSLDAAWFNGTGSKLGGTNLDGLHSLGVGFTLGFQVNDNLLLSAGYFSTVNDHGSGDLRANEFRIGITFGWHALIEGMKRLSGEH